MAAREYIKPGTMFGRVSYISECLSTEKSLRRRCRFSCFCGTEFESRYSHVKGGKITSCGCVSRAMTIARSTSHGHAPRGKATSTYHIYQNMLKRCLNPADPGFDDYGSRGITVCARWRQGFEFFLADMGERPIGLSLDRKNNDGNYEPGNCRWATDAEQAVNRRSNIFIEHDSRRMTASQWSLELGISAGTIRGRAKKGWPPERILAK